MRWLTHVPRAIRDDRGVASIFVVLAMGALLIASAFGVDVGRHVLEARRAQNSADATVLAVATDCARGASLGDYSTYRRGDHSITSPYCGSNETTITATGPVSDGILLSQSAGTVERSATAAWGTLAAAPTLPIVISNCEFSQALLSGTTDIVIYLDDAKPQSGCSSLPGGFSQLLADGCATTISAGGTVAGSPGADLNKVEPCVTPLPHDLLVPMYDAAACQAAGCNGHGPYTILGFAAFHVTGYSFNGNNYGGTLGKKCPDETRGKYCLRGDFIKYVTSQGTPGPSTNFGAVQVHLVS